MNSDSDSRAAPDQTGISPRRRTHNADPLAGRWPASMAVVGGAMLSVGSAVLFLHMHLMPGVRERWLVRALLVLTITATALGLAFMIVGAITCLIERRRIKAGQCRKCGYDVRGLPEPRCPECGTPFEPLHPDP